jgi:O-antigen ligase
MTDSATGAPVTTASDRYGLARVADGAAAAVAASLPWSTSATGILVAVWFVALLPTLDLAMLRREIITPAGAAPLILVALAALGMAWADVGFGQRLAGFDGFLKLLCIPLLLAQFHGSTRGWWVIYGFLAASAALLVLSFALAWIPGLPWRGNMLGVPVKDYITQSGIFALCAFALLGCAIDAWWGGRRRLAWALALLAAAFIADIGFVATSRTTLVALALLVPILGFRKLGWKGAALAGVGGGLLAGALWVSSPYLRQRVTHIAEEVEMYRTEHVISSAGLRIDFWKSSLDAIEKAPIAGSGTGSIPEQLRSAIAPETGIASFATVNPHNQVLVVTIQLGLIGTAALLFMWTAHLLLFRADGPVSWIGLVAVAQNMAGSLFNSHLSDFSEGWIYVFAVGVLGGTALRQAASRPTPGTPFVNLDSLPTRTIPCP